MDEKRKEASYWKSLKNKKVKCELCPHFCIIEEENWGKCKVRENFKGKLYALNYEKPVSISKDPIEKKPLFHFLPETNSYSIGMVGCNLGCSFCQNWSLSQRGANDFSPRTTSVKEIVKNIKKSKCPSVSFTYSEPSISFEYIFDIAKNLGNVKAVTVTNGFINPKPLKELCKYIQASNVDLKSINENFYKKICGGRLKPVLDSIKLMKKSKVWIELTNLLIPGKNDSKKEITKLVKWIKTNLGKDVPLHFTAFYPQYKMLNVQETRIEKLKEARKIAMSLGLRYVYTGNIYDDEGNTTYCPKCKNALIVRRGFRVVKNNLKKGHCSCGKKIPGVWH